MKVIPSVALDFEHKTNLPERQWERQERQASMNQKFGSSREHKHTLVRSAAPTPGLPQTTTVGDESGILCIKNNPSTASKKGQTLSRNYIHQ